MTGNYDDIINLPHHVSKRHPQMSMMNRAAQFAPFAALTGYDDAIKETTRLTDEWMDLDEETNEKLNNTIAQLREKIKEHPSIKITYFKKDEKKDGGSYKTIIGILKNIDDYNNILVMANDIVIPLHTISDIWIVEAGCNQ